MAKRLRTDILHDLKKVAIAINELVRDLDRVEREEADDGRDDEKQTVKC